MNKYLCLVLLTAYLAAIVLGLTDEQKQTLKENHKKCLEETEVDPEKVENLRKGDFTNDDEDLQRYVFCMFRKSDLITEDGHFKKDVAMSKLDDDADRDKVEKAIDACMGEQGPTPHASAFLMAKCFHEEYPEHPML